MTYPLKDGKGGSKVFTSQSGNNYEILLVKTSYFPQFSWDDNVVTVIVKADKIGEHDPRIMNTVLDYLICILEEDSSTIFYWICDNIDGFHKKRDRYFNLLFYKAIRTKLDGLHPELGELGIDKLDYTIPAHGIYHEEYLSYIVSRRHPTYGQVLEAIELILSEIRADKLNIAQLVASRAFAIESVRPPAYLPNIPS